MKLLVARADVAIIGAGMAGASLAAAIGRDANVLLIEAEAWPGYHSTGRSAAFWEESYGGPGVQPLTSASYPFLARHSFLKERGAIHVADEAGLGALDQLVRDFGEVVRLDPLSRDDVAAAVPGIAPRFVAGLAEPSCRDIDAAGLHAHFLGEAKRAGVAQLLDARVQAMEYRGGAWHITTRAGEVQASTIVNAAGAWAGEIAAMAGASPIGVHAFRRTMIQLQVDPPAAADMPLVMDAMGSFYFKPEPGGRIWLSPHDETPTPPCDAAPEELDVAIAIDRFEKAVDWRVLRRERAWAGLRSFAPDRLPIYGFDRLAAGFFWFAGQGGFGIQTAPAAASLGASLLLGRSLRESLAQVDPERYLPSRFGTT